MDTGINHDHFNLSLGLATGISANFVWGFAYLKEHATKGRVATRPPQGPRPEPVQPAFVELNGSRFLGDLPVGLVLEVTRPEGERMVLRWPAGSVVEPCGLVASFLGRSR